MKNFYSLRFPLLFTLFVFALGTPSCKKKRLEKRLHGEWSVTSSITEIKDYLLDTTKGVFFGNGCDTFHFERIYSSTIDYAFFEDHKASRIENIHIRYLDSTASVNTCQLVYGDSVFTRKLEGKWNFASENTLEVTLDSLYEVNKISDFTQDKMSWQTDLHIQGGIINFEGIKYTNLVKK